MMQSQEHWANPALRCSTAGRVSISEPLGLADINAGLQLLPDVPLFLEGSWLMLEKQGANFVATSDANGNPVLGQPIINAVPGVPGSELASFPNPFGFAGSIRVDSTSRLQGWDTNLGLGTCPTTAVRWHSSLVSALWICWND